MKRFERRVLLILVLLAFCDPERAPGDSTSSQWNKATVDTTAGAEYLTGDEKQVVIEINMARTTPAEYARRFLVPLRSFYGRALLQYPGEIAILTHEGVHALDECIGALQAARPVSPLSPAEGLALAARAQVEDQAMTGAIGHIGSDNSTPIERIGRYGKWDIAAGENIDYGNEVPRRIVISLLIDDGAPSRGHRMNLLDARFKFVGVSVGAHPVYGHMCVMDFAGAYR